MINTSDPFTEIRIAYDCIKYGLQELRDLRKRHLMIGFAFCSIHYALSSIFANISSLDLIFPYISNNNEYPYTTAFIYGIITNLIFIISIYTLQYFGSYYYWSHRYCNDTFRDSILSNDNSYEINKIDGLLMSYPWIISPILICNTILNMVIAFTHIGQYQNFNDNSPQCWQWYYHWIDLICTLTTYFIINHMIWRDLKKNHKLFTIQNVIDFYSNQCLQTTQSLLSPHLLYIDGLSQIIMKFIGDEPLPQFNLITLNLQKSIKHLDLQYISRLITFIVTVYSIIKVYLNSFYDDGSRNKSYSNIYVDGE